MAKRDLFLHWNEISIPDHTAPEDLERNATWAELARGAFESYFLAQKARPDLRISFSRGVFHGQVAGRPFQSWLEHWLGKERMQKLKMRAVHPVQHTQPPIEQLDCELSVGGRPGEGITRAHLAESWAWSLGSSDTRSEEYEIHAEKTTIDGDAATMVAVRNLATVQHGERWVQELAEWGQCPSANHVIAEFNGRIIIMYPLDHGYAHVHVHGRDEPSLNAKYRVDEFKPLTDRNPPGLDGFMEAWIAEHRESLLLSWARCQAGKYPLQL